MPSSQTAATERRNDRMMIAHEPPKLKTTLKTSPKQATNPLQFVKVGPCSLYRTAQEQLQKVQEVKKIKQEVRDDPEDWQSNLDNWKSSRRKRQEHIIERVVEVKKLELEEHDRQRRRSKTFSEMMEERSNRGRKLSISLAMYHEEDSNDLSDLGIGTSSGKSSVSGDTHEDTQSVLSDRDSEIDKNNSDSDNTTNENANGNNNMNHNNNSKNNIINNDNNNLSTANKSNVTSIESISKKSTFDNEFHNDRDQREYDSGTTATVSSPEPEEYTYDGTIHGYVTNRVAQNIPRRSLINYDIKHDNVKLNLFEEKTFDEKNVPVVKVDVLKRREIFEKASQKSIDNKVNNNISNRSSGDFSSSKSIKERLSNLERQKQEINEEEKCNKTMNRLSGDMSSIRERLSHLEKQAAERESKTCKSIIDEVEAFIPLRDRLSILDKYTNIDDSPIARTTINLRQNEEFSAKMKDRLCMLDNSRSKDDEKKPVNKQMLGFNNQDARNEMSTPSERSSSPDSEYRAPCAAFHRSLDSLDADASSEPDTFERVQSLEELDYVRRRYPTSVSSAEILNDTDREDSGIHTADVSCSVSQADEPVDEEIVQHPGTIVQVQEIIVEAQEQQISAQSSVEELRKTEISEEKRQEKVDIQPEAVAVIIKESIVIGSNNNNSTTDEETELCCESPKSVEHEEETQTSESTTDDQNAGLPVACSKANQQEDTDQDSESVSSLMDSLSLSHEKESNHSDHYNKLSVFQSNMEFIDTPVPLSKSIPPLNLTSNEEIIAGLVFPLGPPTSVEPPKEKPPPPPTDFSDEENQPIEPLKRLNSTRRIKKELRTRRSDFLGIEGINDDDLELSLAKPPDMAAILAEERRIEQLHRRSYDTDSNYEQDSSHERDSGVELGQAEDWVKQPVSPDMSQHSRQSSEPFGASVTSSEEDEITKKEREIIEVLEKEEQWRYGNDREQNSDIGEKLAHKLRELEEEKMQLERERAQEAELQRQEETLRKNDEDSRKQEEQLLRKQQESTMQQEMVHVEEMELREKELRLDVERFTLHDKMIENESRSMDIRHQEDLHFRPSESQMSEQQKTLPSVVHNREDDYSSRDVLRVERELLQLEQEELQRQRNNMLYLEQKQQQLGGQLQEQWQSLQDVNHDPNMAHAAYRNINIKNYRSSMPNLQLQDNHRRRPAPPPIPPAKPLRLLDQRQRDITIRNSRIPSADSIPQQVDATLRHSASASTLMSHAGQQMTKQTLHALSAVPRTRIVKGDQWVQRRKSDGPRIASQDFNYQHWLIQEAEQRRINEKNQRSPVRKPQQHVTGTSVPYTGNSTKSEGKPLPDSIIQTLTQRIQNRAQERQPIIRRRIEQSVSQEHLPLGHHLPSQHLNMMHQKVHQSPVASSAADSQEKMLSVSGKKKCSHCGDELGRGAAMIIESLRLFYHMECFKCCVCHVRLGDGLMGTDVRVRNHKLHCHNCYSSDDGVKFSCV
ncbi:general transcriptional corepressor trfA [Chelonus insularis]|uniref:general transcriptional corepressor trfA n=1 Tax=Chelonus insularis TaxID=460826 RepID=UPI0015888C3D|nr:general transcriptional corepressor trfA [Chelonus insularis]XP_034939261.1 general transcriptional corepressor trfA [Chelonus insularis]